ncbi:restriction endonuclease subunit S [Gordonia sp. VNK21]|uniref:restriction endonuclease subunit S n=1 Tax=Gordonia sp. VNK21 TaxID=3382483 RepID=UPI0038D4853B
MSNIATTDGWDDRALLDLVTIKSGQVDPREGAFRELPLIAPDHLQSRTGRLIKKETAAAQGAISGKYLVRPGDVIYSKIRPYLQKAYKCDFVALCSADMYPLTPRPGVDSSFILHSLLSRDFTNFVVSVSARSGIPKVNREELAEYRLRVPSEAEQRAIGQELDAVDDLIATLERLIAKKQAIKQGMMQQLLTGRTRLPGFDAAWHSAKLGSITTVTMGQSPAGYTYNSDGRGLPLIQGKADIRDRVTFDRIWTTEPTKTCKEGDVLLTVRAPVGYTAIVSKPSCLGRGVCAISTPRDNSFLFQALVYAESAWSLYEQGSTFTAVNSNEVRSFAIQWPSDASERAAIAAALDDADSVLRTLQDRLTKARTVKTGMMQQLLTGRMRLPVEVAP